MFFPFLRIHKEGVQQVWGGVEESIALGGKDGVEGEKARVFRFTFPVTPHPPPAASYLLPVLPPKVLTTRPLATSVFIDQSSFCFLLLPKILYCCPAKRQLQKKNFSCNLGWSRGHAVATVLLLTQLLKLTATHDHIISSIIVK